MTKPQALAVAVVLTAALAVATLGHARAAFDRGRCDAIVDCPATSDGGL
jgi:hypothetical protein